MCYNHFLFFKIMKVHSTIEIINPMELTPEEKDILNQKNDAPLCMQYLVQQGRDIVIGVRDDMFSRDPEGEKAKLKKWLERYFKTTERRQTIEALLESDHPDEKEKARALIKIILWSEVQKEAQKKK